MIWWDDPIVFILILMFLALYLRKRWLIWTTVGIFTTVSLTPLSMWLMASLEGPGPSEIAAAMAASSLNQIAPTSLSGRPTSSSGQSTPASGQSTSEVSAPVVRRQAIVVLTGGTVHFYSSHDRYEWFWATDRITESIRLFNKNGAPLLLLTGTERKPDYSEREVDSMARLAKEWGVPSSAIVVEDQARNTYENAVNAAKILKEKGITDFYLVTSAFHMKRSIACFKKQGLDPVPFAVDYTEIPTDWKQWLVTPGRKWFYLSIFLHEAIGTVWYWMNGRV